MAQRFPKTERLLRRKEFLRVQASGRRVHTPHFVVMVQPAEQRKLGITVTRRIGNAVVRNRIRRLVRETYRLEHARFPEHCELVVIARQGANVLDYQTVARELTDASAAINRFANPASQPKPAHPVSKGDA